MENFNFYAVFGWMLNELGLSGAEKDIYAIIYGFSQIQDQKYTGGLKYLAESSNVSERTVIRALASLVDKKLIIREELLINNVKFVSYRINDAFPKNIQLPRKYVSGNDKMSVGVTKCQSNSDFWGFKSIENDKMSGNNKININRKSFNELESVLKKEKETNKEKEKKQDEKQEKNTSIYTEIIDYLNEKANRRFTVTEQTKKNINARMREGFKLDDFKYVVDVCIAKWTGTEYEDYIQPSTLFNTKFSERRNWQIQNAQKNSIQKEVVLPKYMQEQKREEQPKQIHDEQIGLEEIEDEVEISELEERIKRRYQK